MRATWPACTSSPSSPIVLSCCPPVLLPPLLPTQPRSGRGLQPCTPEHQPLADRRRSLTASAESRKVRSSAPSSWLCVRGPRPIFQGPAKTALLFPVGHKARHMKKGRYTEVRSSNGTRDFVTVPGGRNDEKRPLHLSCPPSMLPKKGAAEMEYPASGDRIGSAPAGWAGIRAQQLKMRRRGATGQKEVWHGSEQRRAYSAHCLCDSYMKQQAKAHSDSVANLRLQHACAGHPQSPH